MEFILDLACFGVVCLDFKIWISHTAFATFSYSYLLVLLLIVAWKNLFEFSLFFSSDVLFTLEVMMIVLDHTLIYKPILFYY